MLSTPFTSCSIGVATVSAITWADGAGIGRGDVDGRRRDLGIFGDRQCSLGDVADERMISTDKPLQRSAAR